MALRVLRLGNDRVEGEGLRIGTVRRLPHGDVIHKEEQPYGYY